MTSSNNIQSSHHENLKKNVVLLLLVDFTAARVWLPACFISITWTQCSLCMFLSESSDQLVYPHAKLACRWHPALPHTDGIYLTGTVLSFTLRHISALLQFQLHIDLAAKSQTYKS